MPAIVVESTGLLPNHSLERTRPARRDTLKESWPGRSARDRYAPLAAARIIGQNICFAAVARDGSS
jgi:hypothetical protein